MAPPTKLAIATSSVQRLLKEKASYHKEQEAQAAHIQKLEKESSGENSEFMLKQEKRSLEETKAVFAPLDKRIMHALSHLRQQLANDKAAASGDDISKAEQTLEEATSSTS